MRYSQKRASFSLMPLPVGSSYFIWHYHTVTIPQCSTLQWRNTERDDVSNHQLHDCLPNRLFKAQIKENTNAPRHWPLWGEFTAQRASNAENASIWWRHHDKLWYCLRSFPQTNDGKITVDKFKSDYVDKNWLIPITCSLNSVLFGMID